MINKIKSVALLFVILLIWALSFMSLIIMIPIGFIKLVVEVIFKKTNISYAFKKWYHGWMFAIKTEVKNSKIGIQDALRELDLA